MYIQITICIHTHTHICTYIHNADSMMQQIPLPQPLPPTIITHTITRADKQDQGTAVQYVGGGPLFLKCCVIKPGTHRDITTTITTFMSRQDREWGH